MGNKTHKMLSNMEDENSKMMRGSVINKVPERFHVCNVLSTKAGKSFVMINTI